jgi:hypothetical protein
MEAGGASKLAGRTAPLSMSTSSNRTTRLATGSPIGRQSGSATILGLDDLVSALPRGGRGRPRRKPITTNIRMAGQPDGRSDVPATAAGNIGLAVRLISSDAARSCRGGPAALLPDLHRPIMPAGPRHGPRDGLAPCQTHVRGMTGRSLPLGHRSFPGGATHGDVLCPGISHCPVVETRMIHGITTSHIV